MVEVDVDMICGKTIKISMRDMGIIGTRKCTKPVTHFNGSHYFCKHHSKTTKTFVVRDGDVGEILARFHTEKELREEISKYPGMRMQRITKSHRRDLY